MEKELSRREQEEAPRYIGSIRNEAEITQTRDERDPSLRDFYTDYDPLKVTSLDQADYDRYLASLTPEERALLSQNNNYYEIRFRNVGGLVMPLILEFEFTDGSTQHEFIPAEIWRLNHDEVSKIFVFEKELQRIVLDPNLQSADTDRDNNYFPPQQNLNRFELFQQKMLERQYGGGENPMQRARRAREKTDGTN